MDKLNRPLSPASRGFTLVELLIAVAVVAILLGAALPSFQQQLRASRRADAFDAMAAVQQAQERWRGQNPAYTSSLEKLGSAETSHGGYYTLAIKAADGNGYTLVASAVSGTSQAKDGDCKTMTLEVEGATSTTSPAACWKR